ncbi:helix-turn-helix domain-containing protein [Streptomyces cinereoruber]|uniref:helix-turn-helix domain-containing protein n=1 Tax=Streptomyces cinereoruber TaxID=67260 RepID=UPI0036353B52
MTTYTFNGPALRQLRQERKISQVALAGALGLANTSVSHYETGRVTPPAPTLFALAELLDVEPADLMTRAEVAQ